jgi:hypothetical protein
VVRMNDVGGMQGFDPVPGIDSDAYDSDEKSVWGADWQARIWALVIALGINGVYSASELRDAEERASPHEYLAASYYERVVNGLERLLHERGLLSDG